MKGRHSFSTITFDTDKLERWKHLRCVQVEDKGRLIYNIIFYGQVMTLNLSQLFKMTHYSQIKVQMTRLDKRNTVLAKSMSCLSPVNNLETRLGKIAIFEFLPSGG